MNKHTQRLLAMALTVGLLLSLTACGGDSGESTADPLPTFGDSATTVTTTTTPPTTTAPAPKLGLNSLTGVEDMETDNNRPIGFVVTDEDSKHIQLGIESADMYFEAETEGGIPRILAIYSSIDRMPKTIGPVRSARPHFVKMAAAMDMIYCHIGGSETGLQTIRNLGVDDLGNEYEINSILKNSQNRSWNRSAFTRDKVLPAIGNKKYDTVTSRTSPFAFGEKAGDKPAETVVVKISGTYDMAFVYDSAAGVYKKHRNALDTPIHKTYSGDTITAANVIVMFDRRTVDPLDSSRYDFDLESGKGLLASGGTAREICWKRTNKSLRYYEADGITELTVAPGKTYICLTSKTFESQTKIY